MNLTLHHDLGHINKAKYSINFLIKVKYKLKGHTNHNNLLLYLCPVINKKNE